MQVLKSKQNSRHFESLINSIVDGNINLEIKIIDSDGNYIGRQVPICQINKDDELILTKLTEWRNRAKQYFLTQFNATPERTRHWLSEVVLKENTRLIFLIYSETKLIGQFGFKSLTEDSVEIDNLIRGEMGGRHNLIYYAEMALINWLFSTFNVKNIYGFVLANNYSALELHKAVGFKLTELYPLSRKEHGGETYLEIGLAGNISPNGLYYQKIELPSDSFKYKGGSL